MNDLEASFIVCEKCKWVRSDGCEDSVCSKCGHTETTPEGVPKTYYKVTWKALGEIRKENNGKCPYFQEKFSLIKFIKALFKGGEE